MKENNSQQETGGIGESVSQQRMIAALCVCVGLKLVAHRNKDAKERAFDDDCLNDQVR